MCCACPTASPGLIPRRLLAVNPIQQGPGGAPHLCVRVQAPAAAAGAAGQGPRARGERSYCVCLCLLLECTALFVLPVLVRCLPTLPETEAFAPSRRDPPPPLLPQGQRASISLKALADAFPSRPPAMIRGYLKEQDLAVRVSPFRASLIHTPLPPCSPADSACVATRALHSLFCASAPPSPVNPSCSLLLFNRRPWATPSSSRSRTTRGRPLRPSCARS